MSARFCQASVVNAAHRQRFGKSFVFNARRDGELIDIRRFKSFDHFTDLRDGNFNDQFLVAPKRFNRHRFIRRRVFADRICAERQSLRVDKLLENFVNRHFALRFIGCQNQTFGSE